MRGRFVAFARAGNGRIKGDQDIAVGVQNFPVKSPVETAIATGSAHACALTSTGTVSCWGDNEDGQLGDGKTEESNTPVEVSGLTGVSAVAVSTSVTSLVSTLTKLSLWSRSAHRSFLLSGDHIGPK